MSKILVCPLSQVPDILRSHQPSHVITLLSPEYMIETPGGFPPERHLRVSVSDIVECMEGKVHPCDDHISAVLEFARGWDGKRPMLVHCWAGVSRSMAAAFSILCDRAWKGAEYRIAREIRARAPHASPNRLLVSLADAYLGRDGDMVKAVEAMSPPVFVEEGILVEFPLAEFGIEGR
ncbi:putative protein tyrosine phosphatase [Rhizomicrobium palustre]|uniref:Protein tyrosine phosphatase n=1 Tax=Rhizomicrobium palustre TaxID=189966 RepID=A0A846N4L5_9PROT|nr:hypothetical protein [Rhizomicrobium palustre]NIK90132.1 putative protein tyrosine phosphatase [Rhizomicrobium palustre]